MRLIGKAAPVLAIAAAVAQAPAGASMTAEAAAKAFGAREQIQQISLSPDGKRVAIVAPRGPRATAVLIAEPLVGGLPRVVLVATGNPENVRRCTWAANDRLVCDVRFIQEIEGRRLPFSRLLSVGADDKKVSVLTAGANDRSLGVALYGGGVLDYHGGPDGSVLMTRVFVPEMSTGTHMVAQSEGLGVERVDTATLHRTTVEAGRRDVAEYITDGAGAVRVMGVYSSAGEGRIGNRISYSYRKAGERGWQSLGELKLNNGVSEGFNPFAVDPALNVVYGFDQLDGRLALYRISLDGSLTRQLVLANPKVDIDDVVRIGRQKRVVGATFVTEQRQIEYFDPELKRLRAALERALPDHPAIGIVDASADEKTLLIHAGTDTDPGRYYLYTAATRHLTEVLPLRPELAGQPLGAMKPVTYRAADGTEIPAYLTLPPGAAGKGLPTIVMPHGGPGARDEWDFDWWAQFFVARGFAVIQPNFRGSTGYGAAWYQKNGFQSWRTAIGDVNDAARWAVKEGIADPKKLAIVGWSYGGYAALQANVLDPALYKAAIAVAPVTDLEKLRGDSAEDGDAVLVSRYIGTGPHVREGSPARNAAAIKVPVLMFHGDDDQNVRITQSRFMAEQLRQAGAKVELIEFHRLDHQLDDSAARTQMLAKSDAFLRAALGM